MSARLGPAAGAVRSGVAVPLLLIAIRELTVFRRCLSASMAASLIPIAHLGNPAQVQKAQQLHGAVKDAKDTIALLVQRGENQIFIPVRLG